MTLKTKHFENVSDQRLAIIAEAREWLGTKYHHQADLKQVGCDCVGLVTGVGCVLGLMDFDKTSEAWKRYAGYSMMPDPLKMRQGLNDFLHMIPKDDAMPGDILWFRTGTVPQHLAILTDTGTIIHAFRQKQMVIETRMIQFLTDARMLAAWRYPKLED
jgi:NlpC/P60 family putative phage cell wall peptidase